MKWMLLLGVVACGTATHVSAVCTSAATELNYALDFDVKNYEGESSVPFSNQETIFGGCSPTVYARAVFNATHGEFSSNSPFRVDLKVNQNNFRPETIAWLEQNLEIAFGFKDAAAGAKEIFVLEQNTDYPILPGSPIGYEEQFEGGSYFTGENGKGIRSFGLRLHQLTATLNFNSAPSSDMVTQLNAEPVKIKIGDLNIKRRNSNTDHYENRILPMYLKIKIKIKIPTCTMRNASIDLGKTTLSQLNSNTVANPKEFEVEFHCDAVPSGSIYARITDAFNTSNVNNDGILLNQASLSGAATGVGVQLLTDTDQPLKIGSRDQFLYTRKTASTYYKSLKARLYRMPDSTPSIGSVNAQATVLLDYE